MKIGAKIGTGFGIVVLLLLITSGVGIWQLTRVIDAYSQDVMREVEAEKQASRITEFILQARKSEKDFLATKDLGHVDKIKVYLALAGGFVQRLEKTTGKMSTRRKLDQINQHIDLYRNTLDSLVRTVVERGVNENEGVQGRFRRAAHAFERAARQTPVAEGMELYLMARRHEKDYMLRDNKIYIERLKVVLARLRGRVNKSRLPAAKKKSYREFLDTYEAGFTVLVKEDKEIKLRTATMAHSAEETMKLAEEFLAIKKKNADQSLRLINATAGISVKLLWAVSAMAIVCAIGITMLLGRRITRPLLKVAAAAKAISMGEWKAAMNLREQIGGNGTDEIGQLATAFQEMSRSLECSGEKIRHLAYHDSLTGLPNRLMFHEYMKHALARVRREGQMAALLFIDLDNFKNVNDSLGHEAGDDLLRECAQRLARCVRGADYLASARAIGNPGDQAVARFGGDEFTVLLAGLGDPMDTAVVARRIIEELASPFELKGNRIFVGASVGITIAPDDGQEVDQLFKNADMAMYHAKEKGKNRYEFYTAEMNTVAIQRMTMESELRRALEESQFKLFYQPQVDCASGKIVGVEALIRWMHPERGIISPVDFIPLAEENGLINQIGDWVLRTACNTAASWLKKGLGRVDLAVNVSSVQFYEQDLAGRVAEAIDSSGINPSSLEIEITETAILKGETHVSAVLSRLAAMGVQVWMDDFGTGYSSLNHLKQFPINGVKIDRSFISGLNGGSEDSAITTAIIAMAHSLNLVVTAEGVAETGQYDWLRQAGCDRVQGYLIGRPMPETAISEMLRRQQQTDKSLQV